MLCIVGSETVAFGVIVERWLAKFLDYKTIEREILRMSCIIAGSA